MNPNSETTAHWSQVKLVHGVCPPEALPAVAPSIA